MKLLKTLTHPDYPTPGIETERHEAVRIVLVDTRDMVLLIYSEDMEIYKIPGGKITLGEDLVTAAKRESTQELGCETEILGEIGEVIEERPADSESERGNVIQASYCYHGRILSGGELEMSEKKKNRGFEFVWLNKSEVLDRMEKSKPTTVKAELVKNRDILIFEEYLKTQKTYL